MPFQSSLTSSSSRLIDSNSFTHPQITLLIGLESDYITNTDLDGLESLLCRHGDRIEYIVGSIHHVNEISIDDDLPTYRKALDSFGTKKEPDDDRLEAFMLGYFDAQYELIQRFKPEVIAHFDLCRFTIPTFALQIFPLSRKMIERNIRYAVDYGALFEINTAALRKTVSRGGGCRGVYYMTQDPAYLRQSSLLLSDNPSP
jgi:histidinol-phosphatase (PHP family)